MRLAVFTVKGRVLGLDALSPSPSKCCHRRTQTGSSCMQTCVIVSGVNKLEEGLRSRCERIDCARVRSRRADNIPPSSSTARRGDITAYDNALMTPMN
jgi:hypothetical protein